MFRHNMDRFGAGREGISRLAVGFVLVALFFGAGCHIDRKLDGKKKSTVRYTCNQNAHRIKRICNDEKEVLDWAAQYKKYPKLAELNTAVLKKIMLESKSVDKAAGVFYNRIINDPRNKAFLDYLDKRQGELKTKLPNYASRNIILAVAPGMFYKDNPNVGADGRVVREIARELGLKETVIPTEQTGTVERNGEIICEYLRGRKDVKGIILASTSKGSSDIKKALKQCGHEAWFKEKVRGWFSMGGIFRGSPMITAIHDNWRYRLEGRSYFCWNGYNYEGFKSIRAGDKMPLADPMTLPSSLLMVNIVPIPMFRLVVPRARPFYEYLTKDGPNDGMSMLGDIYVPQAITYGSWRNDHYFRFPMYKYRMYAFITYIVEKQFDA